MWGPESPPTGSCPPPQVLPRGLAARSGLRVGDRILAVNGQDLRGATHQEAVSALLRPCLELLLLVRRDPAPPGMRELCIQKAPGEKLGVSIRGGAKGHAGNPCDPTDEGIFISKVRAAASQACPPASGAEGGHQAGGSSLRGLVSLQVSPTGAAGRDGRLRVGLRLLEVNQQSLLGLTHGEAVQLLRGAGDTLTMLVCDGFDTSTSPASEVSAPSTGYGGPSEPSPVDLHQLILGPRAWEAQPLLLRRGGSCGSRLCQAMVCTACSWCAGPGPGQMRHGNRWRAWP